MDGQKRTITIIAAGHWSAALTNGAMRVILPVYYAAVDLAAFTTLSNVFKPVAVLASGFLAESLGSGSAYHFASMLTLCSALTCLRLPNAAAQPTALAAYDRVESVTLK